MTIEKRVGQTIAADVRVEHVGSALTVRVRWALAPGHSTGGIYYPDERVWQSSRDFNIPEHANWSEVLLPGFAGTFPDLTYKTVNGAVYNYADVWIEIREGASDTGNILASGWADDIYKLFYAAFRNPQGVFA